MTTRLPRVLAVASTALALATAACGGGSPRAKAASDPSATPSVTGTPRPDQTPTARQSGTAAPPSQGGGSPTRAPGSGLPYPTNYTPSDNPSGYEPTPLESLKPLPFSAKIEHTCVPVGGSQTLHVTTRGGALVVFDSKYADSTNGGTHGGSDNAGHANDAGRYDKTWTIAPTAPAGTVQVYVSAYASGYKTQATLLTFDIKTVC